MSYQVLARKWRPQNFQEIVGQTHVQKALTQAFTTKQIHHAYLFTGTRGVGKTTFARIIAKSLNCEQGITPNPCGQCTNCTAIQNGQFFDLLEVDAASKTKVEETRSLLENVPYVPTQGRYKVYLIDEVHMLSTHSFNALLKTLEEPPAYVVFILATTEIEKIPATILSRCLQFHLKNCSVEHIVGRLSFILEQEKISFEKNALTPVAKAAQGSMRDALSLAEQALLHSDGKLTEADVYAMLGWVSEEQVAALLECLIKGEAGQLMQHCETIAENSPDYEELLAQLIELLQKVAIAQFVPGTETSSKILYFAHQLSKEQAQLFYQIALMGRRDLNLAPGQRGGFEMVMLRMLAFVPQQEEIAPSPAAAQRPLPQGERQIQKNTPSPLVGRDGGEGWPEIVKQLKLVGMAKQLVIHCALKSKEDKKVHLLIEAVQAPALSDRFIQQIETALREYWKEPIELTIKPHTESTPLETPKFVRDRQVKETVKSDPEVQGFLEEFEGDVL